MATTTVATAQQSSFTNQILHGDCIEVMQQIPTNSVDFILTDPPYLVNYRDRSGRTIQNDVDESWLKPAMTEAYRVLKQDRVAIMFYGWTKIDSFFAAWRSAGFQPVGHIVFRKSYSSKSRFLRYQHEQAFLLAKGRPPLPKQPLGDVMDMPYSGNKYDGPYPMWCAALNLTAGEDLAWQKRKAASFLFSPMFCGWDYMPTSLSRVKGNAYREVAACTDDGRSNGVGYGGQGGAPLIGTAMAASGAAISPNWGFHTKPAIAALLALFNIRIGWWTGNPLDPKGYLKYTPGVSYFLSEMLGMANEESEYVYLSDGGHFENLGLYELIRRRVKFIIASDADADPTYEFGDMANAIEKCKVDFGVQIEMGEYMTISPVPTTRLSTTHFSVGLIHYLPQTAGEVAEGTSPGVLLYIKSSLTGDEPAQVLGQHVPGSDFPHDTTLNQFFNETPFETYRALGEHMGNTIFRRYAAYQREKRGPWPDDNPMTREERAAYVRTFFESFLRDAHKDPTLLHSH